MVVLPTMPNVHINPSFQSESVRIISWTQVTTGQFPHGRSALCCSKKLVAGQIVVTFPLTVANELVGTAVVHAKCLKAFLELVPDESDVVLGRWQKIREKHTRKSSKNGTG